MGSMDCHAKKHSDYWVPNGSKMWITKGSDAETLVVYMRTVAKDQGSKDITTFIVEKGIKGFSTGQKLDKLGMRGYNTCELVLRIVKFRMRMLCLNQTVE